MAKSTKREVKEFLSVAARRKWMDAISIGPCERSISREEVLHKCNYVRLRSRKICLDHFPDFFVVGPQRTGTTWLYSNLLLHPEIFMADKKEIHFYNFLPIPEHERFLTNDLGWYLSHFYDSPLRYRKKKKLMMDLYNMPYDPKVRGESSASYAIIDRKRISDVLAFNPALKVVILVRNPVERAWSNAKRVLGRKTGRKTKDIPEDEMLRFLRDAHQMRSGRFSEILGTWRDSVKDGNLFVRKFDEITSSPEKLMLDLFDFLGVERSDRYISKRSRTVINETEKAAIPERTAQELQMMFSKEFEKLRELGYEW